MRILVIGAGVIGSNLAADLFSSGKDVTLLARGEWADTLEKNGLVIDPIFSPRKKKYHIPVIRELKNEDIYDVIFAVMRYTQVESVIPMLLANGSKNIAFIGNNLSPVKRIKNDKAYLNRIIDANVEGYTAIENAGHEILPDPDKDYRSRKYRRMCYTVYKIMCATVIGKICASDHALNATEEMSALNEGLKKFFEAHRAAWPNYRKLEKDAAVMISGENIEEINTSDLRMLESYMTQDTQLFKDTITGNIRVAKLDASQEEIEAACKKASIHVLMAVGFFMMARKGIWIPCIILAVVWIAHILYFGFRVKTIPNRYSMKMMKGSSGLSA